MIEFKDAVVIAPDSGVPILDATTLTLTEDRISIIGANGSGKSTLARLINGLVIPVSGSVSVDGLDTVKQGAQVRRKVGYLFTDPSINSAGWPISIAGFDGNKSGVLVTRQPQSQITNFGHVTP